VSKKRKFTVYVTLYEVQTTIAVMAESLEDAIRIGREQKREALSGEWLEGDIEVTGVIE
jgi:hypothetical protein